MSLKKYGIYLAYGPVESFRREGLGRLLGEFLRAGQTLENVRFVVVAPVWFKAPFEDLQDAFGLDPSRFDLITPRRAPFLWSVYRTLNRLGRFARQRRMRTRRRGLVGRVRAGAERIVRSAAERLLGTRNPIVATLSVLAMIPVVILLIVVAVAVFLVRTFVRLIPSRIRTVFSPRRMLGTLLNVARYWIGRGRERFSLFIQENEARFLAGLADEQSDVHAWYAPAAFWPQFNLIRRPRLTCVPDVVLAEFPIPFASEAEGGERRRRVLSRIEECIAGSDHFATYSSYVKHYTLVDKFNVRPSKVHVIPHGANRLDDYVTVFGFPNNEKAAHTMAAQYFATALTKATIGRKAERFSSGHLRFLFYPSQFRPNKNVMTLLESYRLLRVQKRLPLKLILTGGGSRAVSDFIQRNSLEDDVLCLNDLTEKELAACYKLAQIAVNPSILEGGMPFTFTEAVSVGTPIIMSDIEVTREIITDPELRAATLFDPYDWQALADKIEWALANKTSLYSLQREFYDNVLSKRTWEDVVSEHIAILDKIAERKQPATAPC